MPGRMEAEIVTEVPQPNPMIAKITELGFEREIIHWPHPNFVTVVATTFTELSELGFELSEFGFFHYVTGIVEAIDPDTVLIEAGLVWEPSPIRKPGVVKRRFVYRY